MSLGYALIPFYRGDFAVYVRVAHAFGGEESHGRIHFFLGVCLQRGRRLDMGYSPLAA